MGRFGCSGQFGGLSLWVLTGGGITESNRLLRALLFLPFRPTINTFCGASVDLFLTQDRLDPETLGVPKCRGMRRVGGEKLS